MFLQAEEIKNKADKENLLSNFMPEACADVAYDLHIKDIITTNDQAKHSSYDLAPGATVFVASNEVVNMPDDLLGHIIIRNSAVRLGLDIAAPVYRPGHKTRIFIRVTNFSQKAVALEAGKSIASIMFYRLEKNVSTPYAGAYADEFDFKKELGIFHKVPTSSESSYEQKIEDMKSIERSLYGNVMVIMSVFVAAFGILNLNISFLNQACSLKDMLVYNVTFLGALAALIAFLSLVISEKKIWHILGLTAIALLLLAGVILKSA